MKNYIVSTQIYLGIGLNMFFPDVFVLYRDIRTPRITNTIKGGVSSKAFKQASSYKGKVNINTRKNSTHGR